MSARSRRLAATLLALALALLAAGCGHSRRHVAPPPARGETAFDRCITAWDTDVSGEISSLVAEASVSGAGTGRMFLFRGGQCGFTDPGLGDQTGATATLVQLTPGGDFAVWINTGHGSPDASVFPVALAFDHAAVSTPNVRIGGDGSVSALPNARFIRVRTWVTIPVSAQTSGEDPPYAVDALNWELYTPEQKIAAISAYAADHPGACDTGALARIALALKSGTFVLNQDDVASTLAADCANPGRLSSSSGLDGPETVFQQALQAFTGLHLRTPPLLPTTLPTLLQGGTMGVSTLAGDGYDISVIKDNGSVISEFDLRRSGPPFDLRFNPDVADQVAQGRAAGANIAPTVIGTDPAYVIDSSLEHDVIWADASFVYSVSVYSAPEMPSDSDLVGVAQTLVPAPASVTPPRRVRAGRHAKRRVRRRAHTTPKRTPRRGAVPTRPTDEGAAASAG
ncbi:MAG TPA: hypothetical protein VHX88_19645 [Solirubrobacteraceae bacterium]|jgi:hypothetical protein|nr:hypothetical protein [Solirubrobacteraceae bacterium]